MNGLKRPNVGETEDDILRQQESFQKKKNLSSFKTEPVKDDEQNFENPALPNLESQYSEIHHKLDSDVINEVVFDVKENDVSHVEPFTFQPPTVSTTRISKFKMKKSSQNRDYKPKKQSIFAQLMEQENNLNDNLPPPSSCDSTEECIIIDGSGLSERTRGNDLKEIHEANLAQLSSMSKEEKLLEQERLKKQLNPDLVKFIQNMKRNKTKISDCLEENIGKKKTNEVKFQIIEEKQDQILKKEGRNDCDALLLEKALEFERIAEDFPKRKSMKSNLDKEMPEVTEELLSMSNQGKWKNMSRIEKEKLEWMSDLPFKNPKNLETGCTARFDFHGNLLFGDTETPTYKGLHHHGEEPDMAGYSIEELLLLARSTVQSQRIVALHTIAHILDNYWYGRMDSCFDEPLLPIILGAGIVPLLRWALDDTSVTSVAATVTAIHSLLICKPDEISLQRTYCWMQGHIMPLIETHGLDEPNIVLEELTDADLIKLDVVKAFLRMDILPRFAYILFVMQPSPLVCQLIVEICAHFCQHSVDSAHQVVSHPSLLKVIFNKFLPLSWKYVDGSTLSDSVDYCSPMPSAIKLLRLIASSDRELALYLIEKCDVISIITLYLTLQPDDAKVPLQDIQLLILETLKVLHVLLCYGYGFEIFLELFPIFLKQMDFCLSLDLNSEKSIRDFDYATHLFKVFEAVAVVLVENEDQINSSAPAVFAIFKASLLCLKKWLWQFPQQNPSDRAINLLSSCLNFVSTFCQKSHDGLVCKHWKPCIEIKDIFNQYLIPCLQSKLFKTLLQKLKFCSAFLSNCTSGNKRDGKTLVSLGGVLWEGDIVPVLKEGSPLPFLLSVFKFCILQKKLFEEVKDEVLSSILNDESVMDYLKDIMLSKLNFCGWFSRFETQLIFQLVMMACLLKNEDNSFWYKTATSLLFLLRFPDECLVEDLFENIIFNETFLNLDPKTSFLLPAISKDYVSCFLLSENLVHSRNLASHNLDLKSVSASSNSDPVLTNDFCYGPIYKLHNKFKLRECCGSFTDENASQLTNCLQWINVCHNLESPLLKNIYGSAEFSYLCMVFLIGSGSETTQFFRDVKELLESCMLLLIKNKKVNLSKVKSSCVTSFDDLYLELLNQYDAVSYCDTTFANFILFPLQQAFPNRWRKLLITDHSTTLRFLSIPLNKVLVPLEFFLEPKEKDITILHQYLALNENGTVNQALCPFIFLISVYHLHNFIFTKEIDFLADQRIFLSKLLKSRRKDLKKWILLFSEVNTDLVTGFSLKTDLSATDKEHLNCILGVSIDFNNIL